MNEHAFGRGWRLSGPCLHYMCKVISLPSLRKEEWRCSEKHHASDTYDGTAHACLILTQGPFSAWLRRGLCSHSSFFKQKWVISAISIKGADGRSSQRSNGIGMFPMFEISRLQHFMGFVPSMMP